MKRTLLFASLLGLLGFTLYAQNGGSAGKTANGAQNTGNVNNSTSRSRGPNARVTVTPGPQGLPTVDSSASLWPLGPALEENLNFWLNGIPQNGGNGGDQSSQPAVQDSRPRTSGQSKPSFEPPPMGGLPSLGAPRPGGREAVSMNPDVAPPDSRVQRDRSPAPEEIPAGEVPQTQGRNGTPPRQNGETAGEQPVSRPQNDQSSVRFSQALTQAPGQNRQDSPIQTQTQTRTQTQTQATRSSPARQDTAPARKVVVVPSPVHYDRAGRRVIDPSWQETMYRMIQAEKNASAPAGVQAEDREQTGQDAERNGNLNGTGNETPGRETIIVVPGPAIWRIRGILTAAKGMLALEDDDGVLWYLPGLDRYIGFIDGLDAGEEAALEGYAPPRGSSQERYFQAIRLFLDETAYDLTIPPYGIPIPAQGPGGQTTIIREVERRGGNQDQRGQPARTGRNTGGQSRADSASRSRRDWYDDPPANTGPVGDRRDSDGWDDEPLVRGRTGQEKPRKGPASPPAWEHSHKSPWAPPPSVLEFEMDYGSIWREDEAKRRQRERDSREIWY